jgi:hypothetical protein
MIEEPAFYARVQRTKIKFVIVVGLAAIAAHYFQ